MSQLIRLVYASRSTFQPTGTALGLDLGVARILAKSRKNNARLQIVGGLLFGEGFFLQCLEGEADAVMALYRKIEADGRHRDVTVLTRTTISGRSFGAWSMKYVPSEAPLQALLKQWGLVQFDPYRLSAAQIETAVQFMLREADAVDTLPGDLDEAPAAPRQAGKPAAVAPPQAPKATRQAPGEPRREARGPAAGRKSYAVPIAVLGLACAAAIGYLVFR